MTASRQGDFVHIEDVAQAYEKAFESEDPGFEIYNLVVGVTISINELADVIVKLMEELYGEVL